MCVIIHKPAGVIIPPNKIESAWKNNKDGVGFTYDDRGEYQIRKFLSKDPDEINKQLEELKDVDTMIHLRFKTKGAVDRSNLHPFTVLSKKKDGVDLQFFHNGTLSSFGDSQQSDSNAFNEEILKPMYKMLAKKYDGDITEMFDDPFAEKVVEEFRTASSVFCLYGPRGQWLHWGKGVDFEEEGFWASNNNYFDTDKRNPPGNSVVNFTPHKTTSTPAKDTQAGTTGIKTPQPSDKACDWLGLRDLRELSFYTQQDFERLVTQHPYEASLLIKDLVTELYWTDHGGVPFDV